MPLALIRWRPCVRSCPSVCPEGTVCGIEGRCLPVISPGEKLKKQAQERRRLARYRTRLALGGGIGGGGSSGTRFGAHIGARQQLLEALGFRVQLLGVLYPNDLTVAGVERGDIAVPVTPYVGPMVRFYLGPALLAGCHWFSGTPTDSTDSVPTDGAFVEGGLRAGFLAGSEEQIDLTALLIVSEPLRFLLGVSYEWR